MRRVFYYVKQQADGSCTKGDKQINERAAQASIEPHSF